MWRTATRSRSFKPLSRVWSRVRNEWPSCSRWAISGAQAARRKTNIKSTTRPETLWLKTGYNPKRNLRIMNIMSTLSPFLQNHTSRQTLLLSSTGSSSWIIHCRAWNSAKGVTTRNNLNNCLSHWTLGRKNCKPNTWNSANANWMRRLRSIIITHSKISGSTPLEAHKMAIKVAAWAELAALTRKAIILVTWAVTKELGLKSKSTCRDKN